MLAYKYRSVSGPGLDRCIEILSDGKLFCAPLHNLNDPMEGYFEASTTDFQILDNIRKMAAKVNAAMKDYRICSLSTIKDSPLMWAYYAQEFRGVAIEFDIMKKVAKIEEVNYTDGNNLAEYDPNDDPDFLARRFLLTKNKAWRHEREIRILERRDQADKEGRVFHKLSKLPTAVFMGVNVDLNARAAILSTCEELGITAHEMVLRGYRIAFRKIIQSEQTSFL